MAGGSGNDFARQLAERAAAGQPQKKFRSIKAPKGSKLAAGYVDRTQNRDAEEEDDKAARVKALEEMMKLQQIDQATFEKLRDEIIGGKLKDTHLVKGLDFKLLERVRRGEDVMSELAQDAATAADENGKEDVDDEFEKLEEQEIAAVAKERTIKKGEMAPPSLVPGKKRNRDQILADMKAARQAAAEAKEAANPRLGDRFKKVGAPKETSRIERDDRGREVLITVDEHGNVKRKVRRIHETAEVKKDHGLLMPDAAVKPLGMEVPESLVPAEEEEEDMDIFDDAGDDYDPLAGLEDDEDDDSDKEATTGPGAPERDTPASSMPPPPKPEAPAASRNYFGTTETSSTSLNPSSSKEFSDPMLLAALKKASSLTTLSAAAQDDEEAARAARHKKMLQQDDRDAEDMDLGFGSSRFEDDADAEDDGRAKLSAWDGGIGDDDDAGRGGSKEKRKRGPKKRKGDANSAADVMRVLEQRKEPKS